MNCWNRRKLLLAGLYLLRHVSLSVSVHKILISSIQWVRSDNRLSIYIIFVFLFFLFFLALNLFSQLPSLLLFFFLSFLTLSIFIASINFCIHLIRSSKLLSCHSSVKNSFAWMFRCKKFSEITKFLGNFLHNNVRPQVLLHLTYFLDLSSTCYLFHFILSAQGF